MIYLDNNATTPIKPEVLEAMMPYLTDRFYNPSSAYSEGQKVAEDIEDARCFFAESINADPDEIYFVSCGSEANNWALRGVDLPNLCIISDIIEHHSVLNAADTCTHYLAGIDPRSGIIEPVNVRAAIKYAKNEDPKYNLLVSTMWINNELGTIQPIKEISQIAKDSGALFHVDAVQAYGKIPIDVQKCKIDMLSTSSHKLGAPRGSGFLYVRKGTPLKPFIYGGQQERHMRAGTENAACIMGFKKAAELAIANMDSNTEKLKELNKYFISIIDTFKQYDIINKDMTTYPSTISLDVGIPAEYILAHLDEFDIFVSSGSACNSHDNKPSHVLKAIGLTDEEADRVIRISFAPDNTKEELEYVAKVLEDGIRLIKK